MHFCMIPAAFDWPCSILRCPVVWWISKSPFCGRNPKAALLYEPSISHLIMIKGRSEQSLSSISVYSPRYMSRRANQHAAVPAVTHPINASLFPSWARAEASTFRPLTTSTHGFLWASHRILWLMREPCRRICRSWSSRWVAGRLCSGACGKASWLLNRGLLFSSLVSSLVYLVIESWSFCCDSLFDETTDCVSYTDFAVLIVKLNTWPWTLWSW